MPEAAPTILVLDDEELIRESLQVFLEAQGWTVAAASSAEQALDMVATAAFDLAIVDIRLPGLSGRDFIVRAHGLRPSLRFLIFTGSTAFALDAELKQVGLAAQDVLAKPLEDLGILARAARRLLAPGGAHASQGTHDPDHR